MRVVLTLLPLTPALSQRERAQTTRYWVARSVSVSMIVPAVLQMKMYPADHNQRGAHDAAATHVKIIGRVSECGNKILE